MKGLKGSDEINEAANAIKVCGGELSKAIQTSLKGDAEESARLIAIIDKTSHTLKNFPRHYSKISKKPL